MRYVLQRFEHQPRLGDVVDLTEIDGDGVGWGLVTWTSPSCLRVTVQGWKGSKRAPRLGREIMVLYAPPAQKRIQFDLLSVWLLLFFATLAFVTILASVLCF